MDLSRWNLPKFSRWTDRYRGFEDFLHQVLDGERSLLDGKNITRAPAPKAVPFAVRDDVENLVNLLPSRGLSSRLKTESVFEALAPFFEAGLFINEVAPANGETTSDARLHSMFLFGRVFVPPSGEDASLPFPLPRVSEGKVIRGRVPPLLQALRLDSLQTLKEASVFAFRPEPGVMFLLVCNRPHPWQVGAIERMFETVMTVLERSKSGAKGARVRSFFGFGS